VILAALRLVGPSDVESPAPPSASESLAVALSRLGNPTRVLKIVTAFASATQT
jgi:hypothetical protein